MGSSNNPSAEASPSGPQDIEYDDVEAQALVKKSFNHCWRQFGSGIIPEDRKTFRCSVCGEPSDVVPELWSKWNTVSSFFSSGQSAHPSVGQYCLLCQQSLCARCIASPPTTCKTLVAVTSDIGALEFPHDWVKDQSVLVDSYCVDCFKEVPVGSACQRCVWCLRCKCCPGVGRGLCDFGRLRPLLILPWQVRTKNSLDRVAQAAMALAVLKKQSSSSILRKAQPPSQPAYQIIPLSAVAVVEDEEEEKERLQHMPSLLRSLSAKFGAAPITGWPIVLIVDRSAMKWLHFGYTLLHPLQVLLLEKVNILHAKEVLGRFKILGEKLVVAVAGTKAALAAVVVAAGDAKFPIVKLPGSLGLKAAREALITAGRTKSDSECMQDFPLWEVVAISGTTEAETLGRNRVQDAIEPSADEGLSILAEEVRPLVDQFSIKFDEPTTVRVSQNDKLVLLDHCDEFQARVNGGMLEISVRTKLNEKETFSVDRSGNIEIRIDGDRVLDTLDRVAIDGVQFDAIEYLAITDDAEAPVACRKRWDALHAGTKGGGSVQTYRLDADDIRKGESWFMGFLFQFDRMGKVTLSDERKRGQRSKTIVDFLGHMPMLSSLPTIFEVPGSAK